MLSVTASMLAFTVTFSPSADLDVAGYKIYAQLSSLGTLVPTDTGVGANLIYDGPNTSYTHQVATGGLEWHVVVAAYDGFDSDNLNYSAVQHVTPTAIVSFIPPVVTVTGEQVFKFPVSTNPPTNTSITLTAVLAGPLTTYLWQYYTGSAWADLAVPKTASTYALTYNNAAWGAATSLRIRCLSGSTSYDEITVIKIYDGAQGADGSGANAVVGVVTNETAALAADSDGVVLQATFTSNAEGDFKVYDGTALVPTASIVFTAVASGCTGDITSAGHYRITDIPQASVASTMLLQAVYNSVTLIKTFSVSKVLSGTDGIKFHVEVESTNGNYFRIAGSKTTVLVPHVFENGVEVTADIPAAKFSWRRVSYVDTSGDAAWNLANAGLATGLKTITLTIDSIYAKATYHCDILS